MDNILYTIIIYPIVQIIEFAFVFAQKLFRETGLSIIFVSGAVSILCLPLYMVAESWQEVERNIQKMLAPKIAKIKAVFTGDERYMILSTYYRQNHYHPVYAMRSTFGLLIQIPFFIAAYSYLSHLDLLKGASFLFISDLGKPDALLPLAGGINLLPILMTAINCAAGVIYTRGLAVRDKLQVYGISILFLLLLYNSPSGLVLYWTLNNVFSLVKNIYFKINISDKLKRTILYIIISLVCLLLIYYILMINTGVIRTRIVVACVFGFIGSLPWLFSLLKKSKGILIRVSFHAKELFTFFILCCLLMWILTGFFIPSMLIASSPQEFSFIDTYTTPLYFLFNTALQSFGFFIFWILMLYFLFSEKTKKIFTLLGIITVYCALINTFLFPGDYGLISIDFIFARLILHNIKEIVVNFTVLFFLSCILAAIFITGRKKICIFLLISPILALTGYSVINLFSINREYQNLALYYKPEQTSVHEIKPLFHLSKTGKNVVVIMLDRGTSVFMPYIFEECPELYEKYSGFTFYPNTVSFNDYTKDGAPPIFGGYEYTPLEINKRDTISIVNKHNEALLMMPRIFADEGFAVTITDPPYAGGSWIPDLGIYSNYPEIKPYITDAAYTDLWLKEHNFNLPFVSSVIKRNMLWYALLREIPLAFRQSIYTDGDWCAPVTGHALRTTINKYSVLDYLPRLTGLESQKENTFLFLVNETTHRDTFMQAPNYTPLLTVTNFGTSPFSKSMLYHCNAAAMILLANWFDFLIKEDVYNNTRIILVADHGPTPNFVTKTNLPFNVDGLNPLLMVKDFNALGNMKTDMTFMTNADVPSITLEGIINDPRNPFTGNKITIESKRKPLYIAIGRVRVKNETQLYLNPQKDYYVQDNIFDENNWTQADRYQP
jgi:membrane protein insertase Oxa1/YidC/SpoIIIJ